MNIPPARAAGPVGRRAAARVTAGSARSRTSAGSITGGSTTTTPRQVFQSSLSYSVHGNAPVGPPVVVAYRLNGQPIPLEPGRPGADGRALGPRVQVDQVAAQIVLTNDYKANDTYAIQNNDPESVPEDGGLPRETGRHGTRRASRCWSRGPRWSAGLVSTGSNSGSDPNRERTSRSATMTRPGRPPHGRRRPCPPGLPKAGRRFWLKADSPRVWPTSIPATRRPLVWPLPFSWAAWEVKLEGLEAWSYEFRVRSVDLNGFARRSPAQTRSRALRECRA